MEYRIASCDGLCFYTQCAFCYCSMTAAHDTMLELMAVMAVDGVGIAELE
jgi:hypothetical protein